MHENAAKALAALRTSTVARIASLRADVAMIVDSASSTTGDDEHDPEGATIGFERAQAMALLDAAHAQLAAHGDVSPPAPGCARPDRCPAGKR